MAKLLTEQPKNLTEYPNSFKRQGAFPLESESVFFSYEAAQSYAKESPIAYVTQPISVVYINEKEEIVVNHYVIGDEQGTLICLGGSKENVHMKADNMQQADLKRIEEFDEFNKQVPQNYQRPFNEELFNVLKRDTRIYTEASSYGGTSSIYTLTGDGETRIFNPWGFTTLEEMFNGQHWPLDWDGNIITEATEDNPTGWYKVIRDEDGNVISYHPTLGTIVQRYNDGNIRVPTIPRDSRDATSKAYVDSSSLNAPGIGTYGFVYKGSSGFGSIPFCSDDAPADGTGSVRANTAAVRTKNAELLCSTTDSSKSFAAVNKKYFTEKTKEYILESVNTYIKSKEGTNILIDDLKDGITKIEVSALANSTIRACSPIIYKGKQEVTGQEPYFSKYVDIYPPRRQYYIFSCDFNNPTGAPIAMVAKLDDSGNGFAASSKLTSGTFSIDVDLTSYNYNEKIRLRFYSNYSGDKLETPPNVTFSNIRFQLRDIDVISEGSSTTTTTTGTTNDDGKLSLNVPDWQPIIVYGAQGEIISVKYQTEIDNQIEEKIREYTDNKFAVKPGEWYSEYVADAVEDEEVRQIRMYGAGIYEYYFRAYDGAISGNGMIYATPDDKYLRYVARDDSDVKVYEYVMKTIDGVVVRTEASVAIRFKQATQPSELTFKMRKIREI